MNGSVHPVTVVDVSIPFGRLVFFLVKVSLAAIPAAVIVALIFWLIVAVIYGLLGLPFRPMQV